ncbi:hypothetical protein C8R46DRAFT_1346449 [Mycena filopes]|nr:hypothetical protein C8R46DRAFT_1346449 [Mycena filopes]
MVNPFWAAPMVALSRRLALSLRLPDSSLSPCLDALSTMSYEQFLAFQQFMNANNNGPPALPPAQGVPVAPNPAPPAPSQGSSTRNAPPPIAHTYSSARTQPTPLIAPMSTHQPFLGMSTLAPSASTLSASHTNQERHRLPASPLDTSSSNRSRVRSANATLPRSATSSLVVRRARGAAQPPPALPYPVRSHAPTYRNSLVEGAENPTLNALVLVYPPPDEAVDYRVYQIIHPDFVEKLEEFNLVYRYQLDLNSSVNDLLAQVIHDMGASPAHYSLLRGNGTKLYTFATTRRSSSRASSLVTNLQLLGLVDKGRKCKKLGVHLRVEPHTMDMTIAAVATDRNRFAGRASIRDGDFVFRLAVMGDSLYGFRSDGRRHSCVSQHIYTIFPKDHNSIEEDNVDTSGGESEEEEEEVARLIWRPSGTSAQTTSTSVASGSGSAAGPSTPSTSRLGAAASAAPSTSQQPRLALRDIAVGPLPPPTPSISPRTPSTPPRTPSTPPRTPIPPTRPVTPSAPFSLPPTIWDENAGYAGFVSRSNGTYGPDGFTRSILAAATRGSSPPPLRVRGTDADDAADKFIQLLDEAGEAGDYTNILSPDRGAALSQDSAYGEGVEREVCTIAYTRLADSGSFLELGEGDYLIPRTLFSIDSPIPIPATRLAAFQRLGALCGLLFIFGHLPPSLSPAVFQYIIHDGDFHSLHPSFIGEWYPALRALILAWLAMAPEDQNLEAYRTHFAVFHNAPASAFRFRDLATHLALAVTMLFRAVLGPNSFNHPELQRFIRGFRLDCRNGFNLPAAIRNFEGGSEPFLSLIATTAILSADSVLPHLHPTSPTNIATYLTSLRSHTGDPAITFQKLVENFLRAVGIPCPVQFAGGRGAYHRIIDLSKINTPAFRPRMLVWAATGSPFLDPSSDPVTLGPIGAQDAGYGPHGSNDDTRALYANHGTFHLQTCFRTIRYPVQHVLRLAQAQYGPGSGSEAGDFQEAFDYWFLDQCLRGIGRHNMS